MINGIFNEHPRAAIAFRKTDERDNYVKFWDTLTTAETEKQI